MKPVCNFLKTFLGIMDPGNICRGANINKIPKNHTLYSHALENPLTCKLQANGCDNGSFVGNDLDKAVLLEPLQNTADRGSGDLEAFAERIFAYDIPWLDF